MIDKSVYIGLLVIIGISIISLVVCICKIYNQRNKLEEMKFYDGVDFVKKEEILDTLISDEMDRYKLLNLFNLTDEDFYLNEQDQKEMINRVTSEVFLRITKAIRINIEMIYNFKEDEELINIIGNKVSLAVLDFAIENNKVK